MQVFPFRKTIAYTRHYLLRSHNSCRSLIAVCIMYIQLPHVCAHGGNWNRNDLLYETVSSMTLLGVLDCYFETGICLQGSAFPVLIELVLSTHSGSRWDQVWTHFCHLLCGLRGGLPVLKPWCEFCKRGLTPTSYGWHGDGGPGIIHSWWHPVGFCDTHRT